MKICLNVLTLVCGLAPLAASAANYSDAVQSDAPIAYYRFQDNVLSSPTDSATNSGSFGTAGDGLYQGATHPVPGALAAGSDTAALFDGVGGRVTVPFAPDLNPSGAFTVEVWLKPGATLTGSTLTAAISSGHLADPRSGWLIYQSASGWNLRTYNQMGTATAVNITGGGTPAANVWYHVAAVWDGSGFAILYVNGVAVATNATAATFVANPDSAFTVGARSDASFFWNGTADEAAFYNVALSDTQILAHYSNGTNSAPAVSYDQVVLADDPVLYLRLNEPVPVYPPAANSGALGAAANGFYLGGAATGPEAPLAPAFVGFEAGNTALQLDGTNDFVGTLTGLLNGKTNFTVSGWIRRAANQAARTGLWGQNDLVEFGYIADATLELWTDGGLDLGNAFPNGEWSHVAIVGDAGTARMYTNGVLAGERTHVPQATNGFRFNIGGGGIFDGAGNFFNGQIDEVAVFDKTLSAEQLGAHYAVAKPTAPVIVRQPAGTNVFEGATVCLSVGVVATPSIRYQWFNFGSPISGATNATLCLNNVTTSDSSTYNVAITNDYGDALSEFAEVVVNPTTPPTVTQQPESQNRCVGGNAVFTVVATGGASLTYQWQRNGVNISGATNSTLVLTNLQSANAGDYTVIVSNASGNTPSSPATLTVLTPAPGSYEAAVLAARPVNYWRLGETSGSTTAFDCMGNLDGVYSNTVTLGIASGVPFGATDTAAEFDGAGGQIVLNGAAIQPPWTAIFWVKRTDPVTPSAALMDDRIAPVSSSLRLEQWQNSGRVGFTRYGVADVTLNYSAPSGEWIQLVFVGRTNGTDIYVNGALTDSNTLSIPLPRRKIGASTSADYLKGQLDEVSIHDKILSASTIAELYAAGAYGPNTPPLFTSEPASMTVFAGSTASLTVAAQGSLPLSYQWKKGGTTIPGATSSTLTISNVYFTDAGSYTVTVSNGAGSIDSAAAVLTVVPVPSYANLTNDLVLHLKFDGDFSDSSGRNNDASAPGGSPTFIAGQVGQAAHIATTPNVNYLTISDPAGDLSFDATASFTVSFWLKYTAAFYDVPIIGNANNSTYNAGWVLSENGGKIMWTAVGGSSVVADPVSGSTPPLNDGTWHQVAVAFDRSGSTAATYVDGVRVDTRGLGTLGTLASGLGLTIGQDPDGNYGSATFDLDDLGIWRRALSDSDIASLHAAGAQYGHTFDTVEPVELFLNVVGNNLDLSWQAGALEEAPAMSGPWTTVTAASAPFFRVTPVPATGMKFYRIKQ